MSIDGEKDDVQENDFSAFEEKANAEISPDPKENEEEEDDPEEDSKEEEAGDEGEEDLEEDSKEEEDDPNEKKPSQKDMHNLRLKRERDAARAEKAELENRLKEIESRLTSPKDDGTKESDKEDSPPDPSDSGKYPLGTLDDRYIQDIVAYNTRVETKKAIDAILQRQEQSAEEAEAEKLVTELRSKADNVAAKGIQIHDDYDTIVVEAGMRGDYELTQTTFEAVSEAEHGAQILYDLAVDPKEASRVAGLSSYQQLKYVSDKNAELAKGKSSKRIPGADAPPGDTPKGRSKRSTISPATSDFAKFEQLANANRK